MLFCFRKYTNESDTASIRFVFLRKNLYTNRTMQINQKEHPLSFTQKKYKLQSIQKVSIVQSLQTFISVFLYQKATFKIIL